MYLHIYIFIIYRRAHHQPNSSRYLFSCAESPFYVFPSVQLIGAAHLRFVSAIVLHQISLLQTSLFLPQQLKDSPTACIFSLYALYFLYLRLRLLYESNARQQKCKSVRILYIIPTYIPHVCIHVHSQHSCFSNIYVFDQYIYER